MSAKTSTARREAFFRALSETGNQTVSAERARVSRSWVCLHSKSDPAFRARMEACIAEARARIRAASAISPGRKWAYLDGEELVIRGTNGVRAQISRARLRQWTAATERVFLRTLAATANVRAACREAGLSVPSAYVHRSKYQAFTDRWEEALEIGMLRVEEAQIASALAGLTGEPIEADAPIPPMSVDDAIRIVRIHGRDARLKHRRNRWPNQYMDPEEARRIILRNVAIVTRVARHKDSPAPDWLR